MIIRLLRSVFSLKRVNALSQKVNFSSPLYLTYSNDKKLNLANTETDSKFSIHEMV